MADEVVVVPLKKVVLDVLLLQLVGWPILFLFLWGNPFHRGFFCDDDSIRHPFHESTVPSWTLYITGFGLNLITPNAVFLSKPAHKFPDALDLIQMLNNRAILAIKRRLFGTNSSDK
ncbi:hypothetical protein HUJ04_004309 [Dendroctonus ponderosae]|nr:hypothetical protein HUJ04_004309 [Dendroctonus ponderosae]